MSNSRFPLQAFTTLSLMIFLIPFFLITNAVQAEKIGVITLHAKWSMPAKHEGWWKEIGKHKLFKKKFQNKCGKGPWRCSEDQTIVGHKKNDVRLVEFALHDEEILIEAPHCAWSKSRKYALPVDEALRECVTPRIERLKKRGAKKIVILGKSLGAAMAIRAGVLFDNLSGIVAMAPGHTPNENFQVSLYNDNVEKAKELIDAGKGNETIEITDLNQGEKMDFNVKAKSFYSMFRYDGESVMVLNTPKLPKKVPLLLIVGSSDVIVKRGHAKEIFDAAPDNPKSEYIEVDGGHDSVGKNGANKIVEWIKNL